MRSFALSLFAALGFAGVSAVPACGSNSGSSASGSCVAFTPPATYSPTTPTVSFQTDVYPIFVASCQFSSCHGAASGSQAGLFLGTTGSAASSAFADLVGVAAQNFPSMKRVAAGDPENSYLMHKLDGDSCSLAGCSGVCANTMPSDLPPGQAELLTVDQRDTVRGWIAQGANDN